MIIDVRLDGLDRTAARFQSHTVPRIRQVQEALQGVAQNAIPQAAESQDGSLTSEQLNTMVDRHIGGLAQGLEDYANRIKAIRSKYTQAQERAITRALLLK